MIMRQGSCGLVQCCNGVTELKQAENKAFNHVFGKCIFHWCDNSCMGTENRLLLSG